MSVIRKKITIPSSLSLHQRKSLSDAIISYIQLRSSDGYDKNGKKFGRYTKKYAEIKGVGTSDVDLILSGEMLNALSVTKQGNNFIEIGYKDDDENAGKAEGNILGTYGNDKPVTKPRDFLGIASDELEILIDSIDNKQEDFSEQDIDKIAQDAAREIFEGIDFVDEP